MLWGTMVAVAGRGGNRTTVYRPDVGRPALRQIVWLTVCVIVCGVVESEHTTGAGGISLTGERKALQLC